MSLHQRWHLLAISTALMVIAITACGQKSDSPEQQPLSIESGNRTVVASPGHSNVFSPAPNFRRKPLIYVVDSYNPDTFGWTREINAGIVQGLRRGGLTQGESYEVVHDTIDAYVHASPAEMEAQGRRILDDIHDKKPDLVLTTDDDALVWVGFKLNDIPVVFNGVNGDPGKYLSSPLIDGIEKPGHSITGAYQTTYFHQSLALAKKLIPKAVTFNVITDKTTTSIALIDALKKIAPQSLPLRWEKTLISDQFDQWKQTLGAWQGKVDVVYLLSANAVKDETGNLMSSGQAIDWIRTHSRIPEVACWAYQVEQGVLASATDDGAKQGELSAMLALKILKGANPGDLPITTPPNGVPALNLARAEKLGFKVPQELISLLIEQGVIFKQ